MLAEKDAAGSCYSLASSHLAHDRIHAYNLSLERFRKQEPGAVAEIVIAGKPENGRDNGEYHLSSVTLFSGAHVHTHGCDLILVYRTYTQNHLSCIAPKMPFSIPLSFPPTQRRPATAHFFVPFGLVDRRYLTTPQRYLEGRYSRALIYPRRRLLWLCYLESCGLSELIVAVGEREYIDQINKR
ncbi:hypothetical protein BDB00DRAFT_489448 [Zychaea mexicana]|uniref:uncharacterized protein n=1 Tax=Zychaea mexicana TaxID=64656 RepID=UPI0022FDD09D|nr:uncharacterized protein BDB00DRAFT_489448 [Zychaea mexicana]KAI9491409.1 hypothetical protein BDB00DRAFT_489448 [Zychaea mexicana]